MAVLLLNLLEKSMAILTNNISKLPFTSETTWYLFNPDKKPLHPVTGGSNGWDKSEYLSKFNIAINTKLNGDYYIGCGIHGLSNKFWLDLDNCYFANEIVDETLESWAIPIVDLAIKLNLYIEKSISGTGLHIAGACDGFENRIHTSHIYVKGDSANKIKSKAIELFLSTSESKCDRGLLITGNIIPESNYDVNEELAVVSKADFIKLFEQVKAHKLVQAINRLSLIHI